MKLLILLILGIFQLSYSLPLIDELDEDIQTKFELNAPYANEEIWEVRKKLNLTKGDQDEYLSVPDLITKYGYPAEEHFTKTSDGYILRMHRIPPTKEGILPCNRTVFLMHGILMSSADWVISGPEKALAYHLADLGYDVWMGNARGNSQSRNHTKLSPKKSKFWKFSWHEIGIYDVPAMIDYVLKVTKEKALYHVGHSQGTTSFYVMCSELPHYNKKIIAHYSLAPIAFMKNAYSSFLRLASQFVGLAEIGANLLGIHEILAHNKFITMMGNDFCAAGDLTEFICKDSLFLITGFDNNEFNETLLPILMGHTPAGCSIRQLFHYGQLIKSGGFRKYDYSPFNALHYGPLHPLSPPSYNLKKVTAPIYLIYSQNDWLSNEIDVMKLCKQLKNCKETILVQEKTFNHMDYMVGIHAKELVYEVLTDNIDRNIKKL